ncbi:MAG: HAMP domain-containing sensor histidine kinase [bacterium]|nr:HAMP domain-containing sensor histidine kinase [bacterium]
MDKKMWIIMLAALAIVMLCVCLCMVIYFMKREKRFSERIQSMLEDAISGKFQEEHLDESRASVIENNMWRYLCDHEVAVRNLEQEQEQMQAQISDISHQAVIPIANIVLYSQLLEEWIEAQKLEDKQEMKGELAAIREQAETLDFLIESLVKLSRLETGIIHVNIRKQPLQVVLDAVKKQFQVIAARKEIQFEVSDTDEYAAFDAKWTIEAVANIVDNAMKYTPFGGKVAIRVLAYSSLVRMDVADTGIGIPEAEQANVFSRFYRSKMVSDRPGVGIGLYLAREVMNAQNGYIKLSSKMGEGSTFSIFFMKEEISQK